MFAGKWIELKIIMLSKPASEMQGSHVFPHIWKLDISINTHKYIYDHLSKNFAIMVLFERLEEDWRGNRMRVANNIEIYCISV
jgi:hypothetical protein